MKAKDTLQAATDGRLLIFASTEYVEYSAFTVIVANNGREIVDELIIPHEYGALYFMRKIQELSEVYGKYAGLIELQTDNAELIRLAINTAGIHVRVKRKKDVEPITRRALDRLEDTGILHELYDIETKDKTKGYRSIRSKLIRLRNLLNDWKGR
jgi:hypothetical protein